MKCGIKTKLVLSIAFAWVTIGAVILYLLLKADRWSADGKVENRTESD